MTPAEQSNYDIMRFLTKLTTYYLTLSKKGMWTWSDNSKPKSDEEDQTLTALSACIKKIDDPDGKVVFWCKTHGWNASHMTPDCRGTKADQDPTTDSDATDTSKQGTIASLSNIPILKS
mmetsp:Transcript_1122/g.1796  ORF Transcript_1122/g.1796 Transcript_1122/m.1796 type:complete len:119 (-) Transcript_1122:2744-3100(-)